MHTVIYVLAYLPIEIIVSHYAIYLSLAHPKAELDEVLPRIEHLRLKLRGKKPW